MGFGEGLYWDWGCKCSRRVEGVRGGYLVILDCKSNLLRENNGFLEYPVSSVYPIFLYQYISIDSSVSGLVLKYWRKWRLLSSNRVEKWWSEIWLLFPWTMPKINLLLRIPKYWFCRSWQIQCSSDRLCFFRIIISGVEPCRDPRL